MPSQPENIVQLGWRYQAAGDRGGAEVDIDAWHGWKGSPRVAFHLHHTSPYEKSRVDQDAASLGVGDISG
jgi:hypothetical protein